MTFQDLFSAYLKRNKMRPIDLARVSKVSRQRINGYLHKGYAPTDEYLKKLIKAMSGLSQKEIQQFWIAQRRQKDSAQLKRVGYGKMQRRMADKLKLSDLCKASISFVITNDAIDKEEAERVKDDSQFKLNDTAETNYELAKFYEERRIATHEKYRKEYRMKAGEYILADCFIRLSPKTSVNFPWVGWHIYSFLGKNVKNGKTIFVESWKSKTKKTKNTKNTVKVEPLMEVPSDQRFSISQKYEEALGMLARLCKVEVPSIYEFAISELETEIEARMALLGQLKNQKEVETAIRAMNDAVKLLQSGHAKLNLKKAVRGLKESLVRERAELEIAKLVVLYFQSLLS